MTDLIQAMINEGVNVFRVNFSHGIHQDHINAIKNIRTVDEQLGTHSAILADLQGPKIRIGDMPEKGLLLENNQEFILTTLEERDLKKSFAEMFKPSHTSFSIKSKKGLSTFILLIVCWLGLMNLPCFRLQLRHLHQHKDSDLE